MDYKDLLNDNKKLKAKLETFHLFFEDLTKYDLAISNGQGILVEMYNAIIKLKLSGNKSSKITEQEDRVKSLLDIFELLQGLKNTCDSQKLLIKHLSFDEIGLKSKIEVLEKELEAIKTAHKQ